MTGSFGFAKLGPINAQAYKGPEKGRTYSTGPAMNWSRPSPSRNSPNLTENATQEAFMRAHRKFDSYHDTQPFSQWIATIANHHCIACIDNRSVTVVPLNCRMRASQSVLDEH